MMPSPWILLAFVIALAGAYFKGCNDGADLAEGQQAKEDRIATVAYNAGQRGAAKAIAGIKINNVTIKQKMETEIREKTVYADCRHSHDGLRVLNSAITGSPESASDRQLPEPDAAH